MKEGLLKHTTENNRSCFIYLIIGNFSVSDVKYKNNLISSRIKFCIPTFIFDREAVAQTCSVKKVFLNVLKNSQGNTCARVYIIIKL